MLKKFISLALSLMLLQSGVALAKTNAEKEAARAEKIRVSMLKFGLGPDARVQIKLRDNAKLAGYISEIGGDSFTLVQADTGAPITISYPQVGQVKGHHLSTGAKIAIGAGIAAAIVVVVLLKARICNESSC